MKLKTLQIDNLQMCIFVYKCISKLNPIYFITFLLSVVIFILIVVELRMLFGTTISKHNLKNAYFQALLNNEHI